MITVTIRYSYGLWSALSAQHGYESQVATGNSLDELLRQLANRFPVFEFTVQSRQ